jgi:hypothetical protein
MATLPSRIPRLFARREIILSTRPQHLEPRRESSEMSAREFRVLRHLMALAEPTRFELSEANFIETCCEPRHESYTMTNHRYLEANSGS